MSVLLAHSLCSGKVFVFSGILPVCGGEDGLAAMLGHEIAHNVAHHAAERTSQMFILIGAMYILSYLFGVPDALSNLLLQYGFVRPGSRKQEVSFNSSVPGFPQSYRRADIDRPRYV